MRILDAIVFILCIVNVVIAIIISNWPSACGWFVGALGYGRLLFESED